MFGALSPVHLTLSFRGAAGTCRTRTRNLSVGVYDRAKHMRDSGFALCRLRRRRAPRNDERGAVDSRALRRPRTRNRK